MLAVRGDSSGPYVCKKVRLNLSVTSGPIAQFKNVVANVATGELFVCRPPVAAFNVPVSS